MPEEKSSEISDKLLVLNHPVNVLLGTRQSSVPLGNLTFSSRIFVSQNFGHVFELWLCERDELNANAVTSV